MAGSDLLYSKLLKPRTLDCFTEARKDEPNLTNEVKGAVSV